MFFRAFSFVATFFLCIAVCQASPDNNTDICTARHCLMVVDAGSTGSRLHLYAYDEDANTNPIHINELYNKKITPGFATIDATANSVNAYLDSLFSQAPNNNMSVYFYATAGMRLIPAAQQQALYDLLKQWFITKPQWNLTEARTINGSEEAVLGWLGLNYRLGTLESNDSSPAGLIEVGGASVQLVFPIENVSNIAREDIARVFAYGREFLIFAHSFLRLGATEVQKQFSDASMCYPQGYPLPSGELANGNATLCEESISQSINADHALNATAESAIKNNPVSTWYTEGAARFVSQQASDVFKDNELMPQAMLNYVDSAYCQQPWSLLQQKYPSDTFINQNCLTGSLFYGLTSAFGLSPEQVIHTLPIDTTADWTLGVVVHQSSAHDPSLNI